MHKKTQWRNTTPPCTFRADVSRRHTCEWVISYTRIRHVTYTCTWINYATCSRSTGWQRLIGSPKLQIIFHKRATKYRSLLPKMTYKDKGSYESSPPCTSLSIGFRAVVDVTTYEEEGEGSEVVPTNILCQSPVFRKTALYILQKRPVYPAKGLYTSAVPMYIWD